MTTHWGIDGNADGWSSRAFAVFFLPLIMLLVHWICVFFTAKDSKNKGQNKKVFGLVIWITPIISLFANGMMYAVSLGQEVPYFIPTLLMGVMFVAVGNYLPKCKQNHTIGIKIKWTLENEENWNATHRFGGRIWVIGGLLLITCSFLPASIIPWAMVASIIVLAVVPFVYSYRYHKKQVQEGTAVITPLPKTRTSKRSTIVSQVAVAIILIFTGVVMFTGDIDLKYEENAFTIEASYWKDLTVEYAVIDHVEYREQDNRGIRTNGLGSARLLAGAFHNEEFGNYTRYSYTKCNSCVVLTAGDNILVLSGPDAKSTMEIYETINSIIK